MGDEMNASPLIGVTLRHTWVVITSQQEEAFTAMKTVSDPVVALGARWVSRRSAGRGCELPGCLPDRIYGNWWEIGGCSFYLSGKVE